MLSHFSVNIVINAASLENCSVIFRGQQTSLATARL